MSIHKATPITLAIAAAVSFVISNSASAATISCNDVKNDTDNCQCIPVANGKNIVVAKKNDCQTPNTSCAATAGDNTEGAWILIPKGACDQINTPAKTGELKAGGMITPEVCDRLVGCTK